MIPASETLLKYDNPVLLTKNVGKATGKASPQSVCVYLCFRCNARQCAILATKAQENMAKESLENILNAILPPIEWTEGGHLWIQNVSTTPATRMDVINLQDHLDRKLQQRQARVTGICPIRRELYAQCFDEIIRQVTINCPERGLLLLRIRNEILMTFAAYNTLYESSTAFGLRKALQGDLGKLKLVNKVSTVELEKRNLEAEYLDLKAKFEAAEKRTGEKRDLDEKKHAEEINFLKNTNRQLKVINGII
uniref:Axonemal dynein light intermediate polypeptide 1 n=1 Tax=Callorhinchus milii TaxID=7868 RepID=A0A4W3I8Y7_CALMI